MRYRNKTNSMRVVLRLIVGLTTGLFVLSFSNALNAGGFTSHKKRFWEVKPVKCGDVLEYGYFQLTGNLTCSQNPALRITGPAKLNLKGHTLSGDEGNNNCILIEGNNARIWNGTVRNCKEGIVIEESDRNKLINVRACENKRRGFRIKNSSENMLINCLAKENGRRGFSIEENGDDNVLAWCVSKNNGQHGFKIEEGDGNKISHSKAFANCRDGIEIDAGRYNLIIDNSVKDNGNRETCDNFATDPTNPDDDYYYKPWYYAGIDVTKGKNQEESYPSEYNEIINNHACGNHGCIGSDTDECKPRERNYLDENVNDEGNCVSLNEWEKNTVCPECTPGPQ